MISIKTNYNSLVAQHHLAINTNNLNKATVKLSTGQKINCAADDAAGCFIASSLKSQISSMEAGHDTTALAINFVSMAESSLSCAYTNLERIKDLATQAANSTMSCDARKAAQNEIDTLLEQSEQGVYNASFNGTKTISYVGISKKILEGDTKNYEVAQIDSVTQQLTNDGSKTIIISTVDELKALAESVNEGDKDWSKGKSFILADDIDLADSGKWTSIGSSVKTFQGTFDGNGHVISNLSQSSSSYMGLFGKTDGATIKNTGLSSVHINNATNYVGGLAGESVNTNIENCYIENFTIDSTGLGVGGLVGKLKKSTIANCYVANGSISGSQSVGGLVGNVATGGTTIISDCYSSSNVTGTSGLCGGLIGSFTGTATNCYATGNVSSTGSFVGGLFGKLCDNSSASNCYATGDVQGDGGCGGFVDCCTGAINNCYSTGTVSGKTGNVGGFVGTNIKPGTISNCYTSGSVVDLSGSSSGSFGLFAGKNEKASIINCYYSGTSTGAVNGIGDDADGKVSDVKCKTQSIKDMYSSLWDSSSWKWSKTGENPTLKMNWVSKSTQISFNVGSGTDDDSYIYYNTNAKLKFDKDLYDVSSVEKAQETIANIDEQLVLISSKLAQIGTAEKRLMSAYDTQENTIKNTSAAKSTILDTDYAKTASEYTQSYILQSISQSVLVSANQMNAGIAKRLLGL